MKLVYTDSATQDIEAAFIWYEQQRRGLGFEFLDCVESSIQSILANPKMYRTYYSIFKGCVIRRFPYTIFYSIEQNYILVHSIFDNRQDPKKKP